MCIIHISLLVLTKQELECTRAFYFLFGLYWLISQGSFWVNLISRHAQNLLENSGVLNSLLEGVALSWRLHSQTKLEEISEMWAFWTMTGLASFPQAGCAVTTGRVWVVRNTQLLSSPLVLLACKCHILFFPGWKLSRGSHFRLSLILDQNHGCNDPQGAAFPCCGVWALHDQILGWESASTLTAQPSK